SGRNGNRLKLRRPGVTQVLGFAERWRKVFPAQTKIKREARRGFDIVLQKGGHMVELLQKQRSAARSQTFVGLDRLNIAEPLRTSILSGTHSQQEIGEVLKRKPSSSQTNVGGFQMLGEPKDTRADGLPAVIPGKSIRPRIRSAAVQPVAQSVSCVKASQRSAHDDIRQARRQGIRRRHSDGSD